jgi:hypothetical protein
MCFFNCRAGVRLPLRLWSRIRHAKYGLRTGPCMFSLATEWVMWAAWFQHENCVSCMLHCTQRAMVSRVHVTAWVLEDVWQPPNAGLRQFVLHTVWCSVSRWHSGLAVGPDVGTGRLPCSPVASVLLDRVVGCPCLGVHGPIELCYSLPGNSAMCKCAASCSLLAHSTAGP